jgi:hypothetical protein
MRKIRDAALAAGLALVISAGPAGAQTVGLTPIEQLHQALHLTPSQEGAWQLYRSASDVPDKAQSRRRAASSLFRTLDAPRRMDLVEAEMRQELVDLQHQSQVLKAFYAALSPEQQHVFDERTLPPAGDGQTQQQY